MSPLLNKGWPIVQAKKYQFLEVPLIVCLKKIKRQVYLSGVDTRNKTHL